MAATTLNTILPAELCAQIDRTAAELDAYDARRSERRADLMTAIRLMGGVIHNFGGITDDPEGGILGYILNDFKDGYDRFKRGAYFNPDEWGFEIFWDPEEEAYDPELVAFYEGERKYE